MCNKKIIGFLYVSVIFLVSQVSSLCVMVNNEQEEFGSVQMAVLQYQKDTDQFPSSWDDLWNNPASRPSVESLIRRQNFGRTDMIESFRFIAPGTTIILPVDGATVIGMMTRPMRPPPDRKLRLLIVKLKDGTRRMKQIEEGNLQSMFSRAGFDLADYTGPDGNWATEIRFPVHPSVSTSSRPKKPLSDPSIEDRTDLLPSDSTIPAAQEKNQTLRSSGIVGLFLAILCTSWYIVMRMKRKNSDP